MEELREQFEKETGWKKERNMFMNVVIISPDFSRYEGKSLETGLVRYYIAFSEWLAEKLLKVMASIDAMRTEIQQCHLLEGAVVKENEALKQELETLKALLKEPMGEGYTAQDVIEAWKEEAEGFEQELEKCLDFITQLRLSNDLDHAESAIEFLKTLTKDQEQ